jgi:hypothetical protein
VGILNVLSIIMQFPGRLHRPFITIYNLLYKYYRKQAMVLLCCLDDVKSLGDRFIEELRTRVAQGIWRPLLCVEILQLKTYELPIRAAYFKSTDKLLSQQ